MLVLVKYHQNLAPKVHCVERRLTFLYAVGVSLSARTGRGNAGYGASHGRQTEYRKTYHVQSY